MVAGRPVALPADMVDGREAAVVVVNWAVVDGRPVVLEWESWAPVEFPFAAAIVVVAFVAMVLELACVTVVGKAVVVALRSLDLVVEFARMVAGSAAVVVLAWETVVGRLADAEARSEVEGRSDDEDGGLTVAGHRMGRTSCVAVGTGAACTTAAVSIKTVRKRIAMLKCVGNMAGR
ncbi:hypothetical protein HK101_007005 [Irineochytrium annulatum]|nr:hypothetical protein HK101_007005 [Irineochytrium annulatum]